MLTVPAVSVNFEGMGLWKWRFYLWTCDFHLCCIDFLMVNPNFSSLGKAGSACLTSRVLSPAPQKRDLCLFPVWFSHSVTQMVEGPSSVIVSTLAITFLVFLRKTVRSGREHKRKAESSFRDGYFGVYIVSYFFFSYMNIPIEYLGYLLMP